MLCVRRDASSRRAVRTIPSRAYRGAVHPVWEHRRFRERRRRLQRLGMEWCGLLSERRSVHRDSDEQAPHFLRYNDLVAADRIVDHAQRCAHRAGSIDSSWCHGELCYSERCGAHHARSAVASWDVRASRVCVRKRTGQRRLLVRECGFNAHRERPSKPNHLGRANSVCSGFNPRKRFESFKPEAHRRLRVQYGQLSGATRRLGQQDPAELCVWKHVRHPESELLRRRREVHRAIRQGYDGGNALCGLSARAQ